MISLQRRIVMLQFSATYGYLSIPVHILLEMNYNCTYEYVCCYYCITPLDTDFDRSYNGNAFDIRPFAHFSFFSGPSCHTYTHTPKRTYCFVRTLQCLTSYTLLLLIYRSVRYLYIQYFWNMSCVDMPYEVKPNNFAL